MKREDLLARRKESRDHQWGVAPVQRSVNSEYVLKKRETAIPEH
jgi:hypothetical protein